MSGQKDKSALTEEERKNNRFSFIVGIGIAMVIIIFFVIFFNH